MVPVGRWAVRMAEVRRRLLPSVRCPAIASPDARRSGPRCSWPCWRIGCLPPAQRGEPGRCRTRRPGCAGVGTAIGVAARIHRGDRRVHERVTSGKLTYHVAFNGSVRASINLLPIAGAMDVSGDDFSSTFTYDFSHDTRTSARSASRFAGSTAMATSSRVRPRGGRSRTSVPVSRTSCSRTSRHRATCSTSAPSA